MAKTISELRHDVELAKIAVLEAQEAVQQCPIGTGAIYEELAIAFAVLGKAWGLAVRLERQGKTDGQTQA